jgi:hypothetical protein
MWLIVSCCSLIVCCAASSSLFRCAILSAHDEQGRDKQEHDDSAEDSSGSVESMFPCVLCESFERIFLQVIHDHPHSFVIAWYAMNAIVVAGITVSSTNMTTSINIHRICLTFFFGEWFLFVARDTSHLIARSGNLWP